MAVFFRVKNKKKKKETTFCAVIIFVSELDVKCNSRLTLVVTAVVLKDCFCFESMADLSKSVNVCHSIKMTKMNSKMMKLAKVIKERGVLIFLSLSKL